MTLIDGKVLNIVTGTISCQCCPICSSKLKQFLQIKDFSSLTFKANPHTLQYGISPLHAWIRFFEFVLRIAYRVDFKVWHVKMNDLKSLRERNIFKTSKEAIVGRARL